MFRITTVRGHLALAGASAVLLALAFPRPGWGWLAHVALVPLTLLALRSTAVRRLAWTSYLVAVIWWLIQLSWLWPVTGGGLVVLCLYLALYWPAIVLTLRLLDRRYQPVMVLTLPMVWVSFELLRGYALAGGFGWFALGHSQAPYSPSPSASAAPGIVLIQVADLFGEHAVSFLVAMTNGLIVDLLTQPWVKPARSGRRRMSRTIHAAIFLWLLLYVGAGIYGIWRVRQTDKVRTPGLRLAVIQTNVPQSNKLHRSPEQDAHDWQRMIDLTRRAMAVEPKPDLIVWPETMVPVGLNQDAWNYFQEMRWSGATRYREEIGALARAFEVSLLVGAYAQYDWQAQVPRRRYNSAYLIHADGSLDDKRYDKVHRVPFGEFIPWVEHWPWLKQQMIRYLTPYDHDYTLSPGTRYTVFETDGVRMAAPICFEDVVPRLCRRMVYGQGARGGLKRADLLVNLTNDGWFAGTAQGPQHLQAAALRCVENRVPMARSVNTGISGFIDSAGRVGPLVEVGGRRQQVAGVAVADVQLDPRRTLFGRLGHLPTAGLAGVCAVLVLGGLLRRDKIMSK